MATTTMPETDEAPSEAAPAAKSPKWLVPAVVMVAAGAGAALGVTIVGPRLVAPPAAATAAEAPAKDTAPTKVYRVDNLIVNPAGTGGTRFLMAAVAIESAEETDKLLREREVQVRDAVTATLAAQTMELLTQAGARDSLKVALSAAVRGVLNQPAAELRIYLPQLVIQ